MKNVKILKLAEVITHFQSRLDGDLKIQLSSEACEWFRVELWPRSFVGSSSLHPSIRFTLEPNPYRLTYTKPPCGERVIAFVEPYVNTILSDELVSCVTNPAWVHAPLELIIAYSDTGMGMVAYERSTLNQEL